MLRGQRVNAYLDERDCADLVLELAPNTETGYKFTVAPKKGLSDVKTPS